MSEIERVIAHARERYRPAPYLGPATMILSREHHRYGIPDWHLRRVIRDARTVRLDLDHTPMLRTPGANALAREIRGALGMKVPSLE
jgi:thioesterase domain-containing protein